MAYNSIPQDILDDLAGRFLTNLPEENRLDPVRLCFQAEKAHWFYSDNLDFYAAGRSGNIPKCNVREFIRQMFQHCSFLRQHAADVDLILEKWREFKSEIPTYGAILLDESLEYVLLVQGFHAKASWGFPKGKANEEELPHNCAIREVQEETGFDISPLIDENDFLERQICDQTNRLYIVAGVPRNFKFEPTTRNEIKECRWFTLDTLPTSRADSSKSDLGIYPTNFYMVYPYVDQLKKWVFNRRGKRNGRTHSSSFTTPMAGSGDFRHQNVQDLRRGNRSSPRVRSSSNCYSSPVFYSGDVSRHQNQSASTSEKGQKPQSSAKQQQQQKKSKKTTMTTTTCKQKLEFTNGEASASGIDPQAMQVMKTLAVSTVDMSPPKTTLPIHTCIVQPSKIWQEFKINWEPIIAAM